MIDALFLIQDVQLLCYTVIFGFVAFQNWRDATRRWLWYGFLANAVGAILDFSTPHLPAWIGHGLNLSMIPLSYTLLNVAVVKFLRRHSWTHWPSAAIIVGTLPFFLAWSGRADQVPSEALGDMAIGLQCLITACVLLVSQEAGTKAPRQVMSAFFFPFAAIELLRPAIAFSLHQNPDTFSHPLEVISSVAYIVSTSVLPLAFIWMMSSRAESELMRQNMQDPLTHVLNRRGLRLAIERETSIESGRRASLTLVLLDLDSFKKLNDTYGHVAGDAVLVGIASLLRRRLRETDTVARLGGEEFVLLLPKTGEAEAKTLLERLRAEIENHVLANDTGMVSVTASFGATTAPAGEPANIVQMMQEADRALYRAKNDGRNCVRFFDTKIDDFTEPTNKDRSL